MKKEILTVFSNKELVNGIYKMVLVGNVDAVTTPGQFINIALPSFTLRRPISVCDVGKNELTVIYKVVGQGTKCMSEFEKGVKLDVLLGLGNGYNLDAVADSALVIGGGVGVPPLYWLTKKLIQAGKQVDVIMGFNTAGEVFYEKEFVSLGANVTITTVDGTRGIKGFVTDAMDNARGDYFFACGPLPMLKAVEKRAAMRGQLSLEERMGCGFGACLGCSVETRNGAKRVCKEGPVFEKGEVIW